MCRSLAAVATAAAPRELAPQPALQQEAQLASQVPLPSKSSLLEWAAALPQLAAAAVPQEVAPQPALQPATQHAALPSPPPLDRAAVLHQLAAAAAPQEAPPQQALQPAPPPAAQPSSPERHPPQEAASDNLQPQWPAPLQALRSPQFEWTAAMPSQPHAMEPLEVAEQPELQPAPQPAPQPASPVPFAAPQSKPLESAAPLPFEQDVAMDECVEEEPDWDGMEVSVTDMHDRTMVCPDVSDTAGNYLLTLSVEAHHTPLSLIVQPPTAWTSI